MFGQHSLPNASHRPLMVGGSLVALGLTLFLIYGWCEFFNERARRELMSKADEATVKQSSLIAAQTASGPEVAVVEARPDPSSTPNVEDVSEDSLPEPVLVAEPVPPARVAAASALLQDFWHASAWSDKGAFVREAARVRPLMQEYYETQRNTDPISSSLVRSSHFLLAGHEVLMFTYISSQPGGELNVALVAGADGNFLLDWESYVGWSDLTFQAFWKKRPTTPQLVRVSAQLDDAYHGELSDPAKNLGLQLLSPDGLYCFHGYCEKTSPVGTLLAGLMAHPSPQRHLTLHLAFPEHSRPDSPVRITGVVAGSWLVLK